jgi:hypothetical protein
MYFPHFKMVFCPHETCVEHQILTVLVKESSIMTKKWVLAAALLSLAVSINCSSAHSPKGIGAFVSVSSDNGLFVLYPAQSLKVTAKVTGNSNTAVTWSLTLTGGGTCTAATCGTLSSTTDNPVTYTAPDQNNVPANVTVTATSVADNTQSDFINFNINHISVQILPNAASVGVGLTEQYTAVVIPDDAPQDVTWSIQQCAGSCGSPPNSSGLYNASGTTAGSTFLIQAAVPASLDASGISQSGLQTIVSSRLLANTTYAFRFSGFNLSGATAFVGSFTVGSDGKTITGGTWDEMTSGGPNERSLTGSYTKSNSSNPPDTNNQGTLTLSPQGTSTYQFNVVFDAAGDIQAIEADANGTGSGVIEPVTGTFNKLGSLAGSFAFGFAGVNYLTGGARTGYVGLVTMDGNGNITAPGLMDTNEAGSNPGSASDITGTYTFVSNGIYKMTITSAALSKTFNFNLYGVSGVSQSGGNPATLYAISTDPVANPGVSGTLVAQDPKLDTTVAGLKSTGVIALTGFDTANVGSNVALILSIPDGKGNVSGQFDQNDAGTILSVSSFNYTYTAAQNGRYVIKLLGNPNANPAVPPVPFVFYASESGRGFLLDQYGSSVMTGTMTQQTSPSGGYAASELPSTYAAATVSSGMTAVDPIVANVLLTCGGGNCSGPNFNPPGSYNVGGTEYDVTGSAKSLTGTFAVLSGGAGSGTDNGIALTAPSSQNYALYMLDAFQSPKKKNVTHFLIMDVDKNTNNASIINVQQ